MKALLSVALVVASARTSLAATRIGPVASYEAFRRTTPESASAVRWGGGIRLVSDIAYPHLALELEAMYKQEDTKFESANTYQEKTYRGRGGLLVRLLGTGALGLNVRGGAQFSQVSGDYAVKALNLTQKSTLKYWAPYAGLELALTPLSGFGIELGTTFAYDKSVKAWVPEFFLCIALK